MKLNTITEDSIKLLVDSFYLEVRKSSELKDIFENTIGRDAEDWKLHLEKMYSFWSSIMLRTGKYHGNPLKTHRELPYFPPELFSVWLLLFENTAKDLFDENVGSLFVEKSRIISRTLLAGMYK